MTFTPAELDYLHSQHLGRLCTISPAGQPQIRPVGVHLTEDEEAIEIVGHALRSTQKWRNVLHNPEVAFIVDNLITIEPPRARGIEIRGLARAQPGAGTTAGGLSGDVIRIRPRRILAWGLDGPDTAGRDIEQPK